MVKRVFNLCRSGHQRDTVRYQQQLRREMHRFKNPCGFSYCGRARVNYGLVFIGSTAQVLCRGTVRVLELECVSFKRRVLSAVVFCVARSKGIAMALHVGDARAFAFLRDVQIDALLMDPETQDLALFISNRLAEAPVFVCASYDVVKLTHACGTSARRYAATYFALQSEQAQTRETQAQKHGAAEQPAKDAVEKLKEPKQAGAAVNMRENAQQTVCKCGREIKQENAQADPQAALTDQVGLASTNKPEKPNKEENLADLSASTAAASPAQLSELPKRPGSAQQQKAPAVLLSAPPSVPQCVLVRPPSAPPRLPSQLPLPGGLPALPELHFQRAQRDSGNVRRARLTEHNMHVLSVANRFLASFGDGTPAGQQIGATQFHAPHRQQLDQLRLFLQRQQGAGAQASQIQRDGAGVERLTEASGGSLQLISAVGSAASGVSGGAFNSVFGAATGRVVDTFTSSATGISTSASVATSTAQKIILPPFPISMPPPPAFSLPSSQPSPNMPNLPPPPPLSEAQRRILTGQQPTQSFGQNCVQSSAYHHDVGTATVTLEQIKQLTVPSISITNASATLTAVSAAQITLPTLSTLTDTTANGAIAATDTYSATEAATNHSSKPISAPRADLAGMGAGAHLWRPVIGQSVARSHETQTRLASDYAKPSQAVAFKTATSKTEFAAETPSKTVQSRPAAKTVQAALFGLQKAQTNPAAKLFASNRGSAKTPKSVVQPGVTRNQRRCGSEAANQAWIWRAEWESDVSNENMKRLAEAAKALRKAKRRSVRVAWPQGRVHLMKTLMWFRIADFTAKLNAERSMPTQKPCRAFIRQVRAQHIPKRLLYAATLQQLGVALARRKPAVRKRHKKSTAPAKKCALKCPKCGKQCGKNASTECAKCGCKLSQTAGDKIAVKTHRPRKLRYAQPRSHSSWAKRRLRERKHVLNLKQTKFNAVYDDTKHYQMHAAQIAQQLHKLDPAEFCDCKQLRVKKYDFQDGFRSIQQFPWRALNRVRRGGKTRIYKKLMHPAVVAMLAGKHQSVPSGPECRANPHMQAPASNQQRSESTDTAPLHMDDKALALPLAALCEEIRAFEANAALPGVKADKSKARKTKHSKKTRRSRHRVKYIDGHRINVRCIKKILVTKKPPQQPKKRGRKPKTHRVRGAAQKTARVSARPDAFTVVAKRPALLRCDPNAFVRNAADARAAIERCKTRESAYFGVYANSWVHAFEAGLYGKVQWHVGYAYDEPFVLRESPPRLTALPRFSWVESASSVRRMADAQKQADLREVRSLPNTWRSYSASERGIRGLPCLEGGNPHFSALRAGVERVPLKLPRGIKKSAIQAESYALGSKPASSGGIAQRFNARREQTAILEEKTRQARQKRSGSGGQAAQDRFQPRSAPTLTETRPDAMQQAVARGSSEAPVHEAEAQDPLLAVLIQYAAPQRQPTSEAGANGAPTNAQATNQGIIDYVLPRVDWRGLLCGLSAAERLHALRELEKRPFFRRQCLQVLGAFPTLVRTVGACVGGAKSTENAESVSNSLQNDPRNNENPSFSDDCTGMDNTDDVTESTAKAEKKEQTRRAKKAENAERMKHCKYEVGNGIDEREEGDPAFISLEANMNDDKLYRSKEYDIDLSLFGTAELPQPATVVQTDKRRSKSATTRKQTKTTVPANNTDRGESETPPEAEHAQNTARLAADSDGEPH